MRLWMRLAAAGSMLLLGVAVSAAETDRKDAGDGQATSRPAVKTERGGRDAESRWPGRGGRGEGHSYRSPSDRLPLLDDGSSRHGEGRGFGSSGFGGEHGSGPMFGASPERIEKAMDFLKEQYPKLYEHLGELKEKDPRAFHRQMGRIMPRMPELMNIIERDPKLGKLIIDEHRLEMEIRDAVVEYRKVKDQGENATLKDRIRELISQQFDVRQEKLKLMIANMERELERKKQFLAEQAAKKDNVIDRDLQRWIEPDR